MCYMYCLFHRYKLTFMAFDGTTEAQMFSFDNIAKAIIGKPCASLVDQQAIHSPMLLHVLKMKWLLYEHEFC